MHHYHWPVFGVRMISILQLKILRNSSNFLTLKRRKLLREQKSRHFPCCPPYGKALSLASSLSAAKKPHFLASNPFGGGVDLSLKNSLGDLPGFLAVFSKVSTPNHKSLSGQLHSINKCRGRGNSEYPPETVRVVRKRAAIDAALAFLWLGLRSNSSVLLSASGKL